MNTNLKPVSQYRNGVLIARYPSIAVAAFLSETQPAHIGKVAAGLRESAGGFNWEFAPSFGVSLTRANPGLSQIDLENDDSVVAHYDSIETAALMSGLTIAQIGKVLSGGRKSVDGYTFR